MEGMSSWGNADKEPTKQIQLTPEIVTQDSTKVDQHLAEALLKVNEEKLTHDKANAVDTIRELTKLSKLDNTFEEVRNNAVYQLDHLARTFRGAVIKIPSSEIYRKLQSQNLTLEESQSRYALAFPGYRFSDDMSYITHIPYKGYTIQLHTPVSTAKYMSGECLLALKHDDDSREGSGVVFTALNADTPEFIIRWLQRGRSEDSVFQDDTIDQSAQPDISTEILEFQPTEVLPPQYQVEKRQSRWRRITQKIGVGLATILVGLNINLKNAYTPTQPSSETQPSSTIEYVTPESVIEAPRTRKSPVHTEVNPDFTQLETGESLRSEIQKYLGNEATEADIDTFQRLYLATDTGRNTIWKLSQLTEQGRIYAQELGIQSPDALSLDQLSILANHLGTGELFGFAEVDFLSEHEPHKMDRQEMRAFRESSLWGRSCFEWNNSPTRSSTTLL